MSIYLLPLIVFLIGMNAAAQPTTQPESKGELIFQSFTNAPYPHASRKEGWKYQDKVYPADVHYSDSTIGIFIPRTFKPSEQVDLVVHFHGWGNNSQKVISQFGLEDQILKSGRNAILLAPQGPKDASDSGSGKMEEPGGFQRMIEEVVTYLHEQKKIPTKKIGKIVIAGHSGGYKALGYICKHGGLRDNITDVLLFDASYGQLELFADWCALKGNRRLVSIFTEHLATENWQLATLLQDRNVEMDLAMEANVDKNRLLQRKPILFHTTELTHNDVLAKKDYFALWLRTSALPAVESP